MDLKQKFNRATVLVLKHVDAQINLDLLNLTQSRNWSRKPNKKASENTSASIGDLILLISRCDEDQAGANRDARRRPWMAEVSTKLQLFRWIAGADHAT
jgi:hypothetical protein